MRRRAGPLKILFLAVLAASAAWLWAAFVLPPYLRAALSRAFGEQLAIGTVELQFPRILRVTSVRLAGTSTATPFVSREIRARIRWISWTERILWIDRLEFDGVLLQFHRTASGTVVWPDLTTLLPPSFRGAAPADASPTGWRVRIREVVVTDGNVAVEDDNLAESFHGELRNLSATLGPIATPSATSPLLFAVQTDVMGYRGYEAPLFCSGWMLPRGWEFDLSCQLKSLRLAAFEPYYSGPIQVRVYNATLEATGALRSQHNALAGRVQLEIGELSEADLSVRGRTLVDVKRLAGGVPPHLTGEVVLSGPTDQPGQWKVQLTPGDEVVQRLVQPLVNRGIETIRIRFGLNVIPVGLAPTSQAAMSDIETASKTVEENLRLLAPVVLETPPEIPTETPRPLPSLSPVVSPAAPATPAPSAPFSEPQEEQPSRPSEASSAAPSPETPSTPDAPSSSSPPVAPSSEIR